METTRRVLLSVLWGSVLIALILILLYENDILSQGKLVGNVKAEYFTSVFMDLLACLFIPLCLWLFRWSVVKRSLQAHKEKALLRWGLFRLLMLCVPMLVCLLLYYFYQNVAFGYLAIIFAICLFFVYPSMSRCLSEIDTENDTNTEK